MKSFLVLLTAIAAATLLALGQTGPAGVANPNPSNAAGSPAPNAAAPSLNGNAGDAASSVPLPGSSPGQNLEKTMPLIPETAPAGGGRPRSRKGKRTAGANPEASAAPGSTPHGTYQVEQDIRVRIRMREAANIAANDPNIQEDWVAVHRTRTDPERRTALKKYYNALYDRMIKIDPTIADRVNLRRLAAINRMSSTRLGDDAGYDPYATPTPPEEEQNPPSTDAPPPQ